MLQLGNVYTVKVLLHVLWQPLASVIVAVYVPAALMGPVHCVVTLNPPGPLHAYDAMPAVAQNDVVAPTQIAFVPVMLQFGNVYTVKVLLHVLWHPLASVIVTV